MSYVRTVDYSPERLADAIVQKLVALGVAVPGTSGPPAGWARAAEGRSPVKRDPSARSRQS